MNKKIRQMLEDNECTGGMDFLLLEIFDDESGTLVAISKENRTRTVVKEFNSLAEIIIYLETLDG